MLDGQKQDAFEALVADWIGEVGQLHRQIQKLPVEIDVALSPTKKLLAKSQDELAQQLNALPGAADREMKRAGAEAILVFSKDIERLSLQLAEISSAKERYRAVYWAAGSLTLFSLFFFCAGSFFSGQSVGWGTLFSTFFTGLAGGIFLMLSFSRTEKKTPTSAASHTLERLDYPPPTWSLDEFNQFSLTLDEHFSERTLRAAKEVLVFGKEALQASHDNKLLPGQLGRVLLKLRGEKLK